MLFHLKHTQEEWKLQQHICFIFYCTIMLCAHHSSTALRQ
uniref:Uncharacterized protein n=1 Tax=Arundo donax TaxID=35708 RepID=A0A0A8ZIE6_ARUDO